MSKRIQLVKSLKLYKHRLKSNNENAVDIFGANGYEYFDTSFSDNDHSASSFSSVADAGGDMGRA